MHAFVLPGGEHQNVSGEVVPPSTVPVHFQRCWSFQEEQGEDRDGGGWRVPASHKTIPLYKYETIQPQLH